ncbi:MAG: DUF4252 domain-containing protein [Paramuribaculum sp.]|nr:DUF4252 domain-containing protein [Bacteroides sp.]MDE6825841.1 DUF4252 domain-containing protein [Paramuribaculum sp.]
MRRVMKLIAAVAIAVLMSQTTTGCIRGSKRFADLKDIDGVETLRVGMSVSKLADFALKKDKIGSGKNDVSNYMKSIKDIEVVSCDESSSIDIVAEKCQSIMDGLGYIPLLVRNEENGERTTIYIGPDGKHEGEATGLIVLDRSSGEYDLVLIEGTVEVQKLTDHFINEEKGWQRVAR